MSKYGLSKEQIEESRRKYTLHLILYIKKGRDNAVK